MSHGADHARSRAGVLAIPAILFALLLLAGSAQAAAPANDNFSDAAAVTGASGTTSGTNVEATPETGEPSNHVDDCCTDGDLGDASVWYQWTAPSTGLFFFDTQGSDLLGHDTVLGVYTGSLGTLTEVGFNDDYGGDCCESRVVFPTTSGAT